MSLLFREHESDAHSAAEIITEGVREGICFTFDDSRFDRSEEKRKFSQSLLMKLISNLNHMKGELQ